MESVTGKKPGGFVSPSYNDRNVPEMAHTSSTRSEQWRAVEKWASEIHLLPTPVLLTLILSKSFLFLCLSFIFAQQECAVAAE